MVKKESSDELEEQTPNGLVEEREDRYTETYNSDTEDHYIQQFLSE